MICSKMTSQALISRIHCTLSANQKRSRYWVQYNYCDYILNSAFLIGRKRTVNFRNQRLWRHNCRLDNNHVKDTQGHGESCHVWHRCMISKGNHVKFAHFVLLAVSEEAKTWLLFLSMYNKTIIRYGFCIIQNNQGRGKGYQPKPSDITKTSSSNCLESTAIHILSGKG